MLERFQWTDFAWDESKNAANKAKHRLSFETAALVFEAGVLVKADDRWDYGEERFLATGCIEGHFVTLVFTIRDPNVCRIISARGASRNEREAYQQARPQEG